MRIAKQSSTDGSGAPEAREGEIDCFGLGEAAVLHAFMGFNPGLCHMAESEVSAEALRIRLEWCLHYFVDLNEAQLCFAVSAWCCELEFQRTYLRLLICVWLIRTVVYQIRRSASRRNADSMDTKRVSGILFEKSARFDEETTAKELNPHGLSTPERNCVVW